MADPAKSAPLLANDVEGGTAYVDVDAQEDSTLAKRPYFNFVVSLLAMALIAASSAKVTFGCAFDVTASSGNLLTGPPGLKDYSTQYTCASLFKQAPTNNADACTQLPACQFYYNGVPASTGDCNSQNAGTCGCTLNPADVIDVDLSYSLDLKLSKEQFCFDCKCKSGAAKCFGDDKDTSGKCWGGIAAQLANKTTGGGFASLPVSLDLLFDSSTCESRYTILTFSHHLLTQIPHRHSFKLRCKNF